MATPSNVNCLFIIWRMIMQDHSSFLTKSLSGNPDEYSWLLDSQRSFTVPAQVVRLTHPIHYKWNLLLIKLGLRETKSRK